MFAESNMVFDDYEWSTYGDDDPRVMGEPDSTLLNRKEGYEVLYFINKMAEIYNIQDKRSCKKMEIMIREKLPGNIRSQENVKDWVEKNWELYTY